MKIFFKPTMILLYLLIFLSNSCNNEEVFTDQGAINTPLLDSDSSGLSEDAIDDKLIVSVKNDTIITNQNIAFSFNPFTNDINIPSNFTISAVSPTSGTVTIDDNTTPGNLLDDIITYTPNVGFIGTDTFEYSVCDPMDSLNCGTAQVFIRVATIAQDNNISSNVIRLKKLFDAQTIDDEYQIKLSLSGDGGDIYYFDVSPYVYMFQATGEDSYMDFAIELFQNVIQTANDGAILNDGYLGWKDDASGITNGVGVNDGTEVPLAESRGMRTVARMLWVLSKSPTYLSKGMNQNKYDTMLSWFKTNVWEKWYARGLNNLYRSRTHMSSHWGQIAWFLNEIKNESKYRTVYYGWCSDITEGSYKGESMRKQLREVYLSSGNVGYIWNSKWGSMTDSNDVSHSNAEVELMVLGAEMNDYWTLNDMEKLINTFDQLIIKSSNWDNNAEFIDGSGSKPALWDQGWVQLGRFSEALQSKLESAELLPTAYHYQKIRIANLAYNRAFLEGNLIYPEK